MVLSKILGVITRFASHADVLPLPWSARAHGGHGLAVQAGGARGSKRKRVAGDDGEEQEESEEGDEDE